jgi:hypothetical protein
MNTAWSAPTESLLLPPYNDPPRELPIALAHKLAKTRVSEPYLATLNRLYAGLSWADKAKCRAELYRRREEQRGATMAQCG